MNVVRWIVAAAVSLLGCWCLLWLTAFVALGFFATGPAVTDYLILAAWVVVLFVAAYLIQPWRPSSRRPRREGL